MRIAKAEARKRFSEVMTWAGRGGHRVKITHYGKTLAVLVSKRDFEMLNDCEAARRASKLAAGKAPPADVSPRRRVAASARRKPT